MNLPIPLDSSIRAEYADGFIIDETALLDRSPYNQDENVFRAILNKAPEEEHGALVKLTTFFRDHMYTIDWTKVPEGSRPIRFRHGFSTTDMGGNVIASGWSGVDFGYQYTKEGRNYEFKKEIR
ncbi:MAG: hypothetical protein KGZ81_07410 [Flavobacteriales bacterium]|nr:hypothetical protein [Flavobacteriales bacterium]